MEKSMRGGVKKFNIWPYVLLAPALIIMICVVFYPICSAVLISFQNYNLAKPSANAFVAFKNFTDLLFPANKLQRIDFDFWQGLVRTIKWVVFGVGGQFLFGFILALLLNKKFRGRGVVRAVSLIPWVTPGVLLALIWRLMYQSPNGIITVALRSMGILSANETLLNNYPMASAIVTIIWQGIPFFALMILAGLQGISHDMYDAADIDGATGWQKLLFVTIPSLRNTIMVTLMLRIIWVANSVDVIWGMTDGSTPAVQTLSVLIYKKAQSLNMGKAAAAALLLMIVLLLVSIPYIKMSFSEKE